MKKTLIILALILATVANKIQAQAFSKGAVIVSAGYGFPNLQKTLFNLYNIYTGYTVKGFGPAHAKIEYGVNDYIGIGLAINYVNSSVSFTDQYNYKLAYNNFKVNLRTNVHYGTAEKIDFYSGLGVGYGNSSFNWTTNDPDGVPSESVIIPINIGFEATTGARYFFTDNIGMYAEIGLAKSIIQIGASFKFGGSSGNSKW
jgi:opacity protein-like surface antigen